MFYLVEFFQTFGRIFLFAYAFYDFPLCSITVFMQLIMKIFQMQLYEKHNAK